MKLPYKASIPQPRVFLGEDPMAGHLYQFQLHLIEEDYISNPLLPVKKVVTISEQKAASRQLIETNA